MCGIAGILGQTVNVRETMQLMLERQRHRGPDAEGVWQDNQIIMGHNRLSIIDLSDAANQPMSSSCGRYTIVFNGEIYNYLELREELKRSYPFTTHSDTEVILNAYKAWGMNMLDRFIGMFAFAIWDNQNQNLILARDRFGVKPLYYAIQNNVLCFASEIKALWAVGVPKRMNLKVWANYLNHGSYGLPNECFWDGIQQLPGGHYLELNNSLICSGNSLNLIPVKWYDFVHAVERIPTVSEVELKEEYVLLLNEAIRLRFRADVPIGFNISGGLDSSILLSLVKQQNPNNNSIESFSFYTGNSDYDELPWVKQMISRTSFPLNPCKLDASEVPELFNLVSFHEDEPFGGLPTLAYSKIFSQARQKGIKVLLDGQGIDEAWAGYDYYRSHSDATIQGLQSNPYRPQVMSDELAKWVEREAYPQPFKSRLQNLQYRDIFYTKIPRALRFNDRISMMHSTELREPFLDHRLVELAFAQPDHVKLREQIGKALLREWASDWLGDSLSLAPKRPLQTPQREWLRHDLQDWVTTQLSDLTYTTDLVHGKQMNELYKQYRMGNESSSFYILQWLSLSQAIKNSPAA